MNLSKETTMMVLEHLIRIFNETKDEYNLLILEAEIKCFQFHLKGFEK